MKGQKQRKRRDGLKLGGLAVFVSEPLVRPVANSIGFSGFWAEFVSGYLVGMKKIRG